MRVCSGQEECSEQRKNNSLGMRMEYRIFWCQRCFKMSSFIECKQWPQTTDQNWIPEAGKRSAEGQNVSFNFLPGKLPKFPFQKKSFPAYRERVLSLETHFPGLLGQQPASSCQKRFPYLMSFSGRSRPHCVFQVWGDWLSGLASTWLVIRHESPATTVSLARDNWCTEQLRALCPCG